MSGPERGGTGYHDILHDVVAAADGYHACFLQICFEACGLSMLVFCKFVLMHVASPKRSRSLVVLSTSFLSAR
jgi:hypothetical protein